jgi:hypothetical protein
MINVIDKDFNFKTKIIEFKSLRLEHTYSECGEFEFILPINENSEIIDVDDYIFIRPEEPFLVEDVIEDDNLLIVKGSELKKMCNWRVVEETGSATSATGTQMYHLINRQFSAVGKVIPLYFSEVFSGIITYYNRKNTNLLNDVKELAIYGEIGWKFALDLINKKIKVIIYQGKDRTINQTENNIILFKNEFKNIRIKTTKSKRNYVNFIYAVKDGILSKVGTPVDYNRRELAITGTSDDANKRIAELSNIYNFDIEVISEINSFFRTDYYLGDKVTIKTKKTQQDLRVTKVTEFYEKGLKKTLITIGYDKNTLKSVIDNRLKDLELLKG